MKRLKYLLNIWFFFLLPFLLSACSVASIKIEHSSMSICKVQLRNSEGEELGNQAWYLVFNIETDQSLNEYTNAMIQFRGNVILANGDRFLELGTGTRKKNFNQFISLEIKNNQQVLNNLKKYSIFLFRNLVLDYDGSFKINLLKDDYDKIEFNVSYRVYSGPEFARSEITIVTRKEFIKIYESRNVSEEPVSLIIQ